MLASGTWMEQEWFQDSLIIIQTFKAQSCYHVEEGSTVGRLSTTLYDCKFSRGEGLTLIIYEKLSSSEKGNTCRART